MNSSVKHFVKAHIINEKHPFNFLIYHSIIKSFLMRRKSYLTYSQIEADISKKYAKIFHRNLNWDNPQTYNEKIHVSKLYMPSPLKTMLADKYLVRNWITAKIGQQYLIPLLGVYDHFDEINFDTLPDKFVIKCNHDSGSVTLVKDKSKVNLHFLMLKYNALMRQNYAWAGFEMHYRDIKPKIIIEQYMGDAISDYKFLCFDGNPSYCWVDFDRYSNHKRNVYNMNWELQPFNQHNYGIYTGSVSCPENFAEMKNIASVLSQGFEHVRVDLYALNRKIYFGEMTFANGNGFEKITPDEYSLKLGALWPFDNSIRRKVLASRSKP